MIIATAVILAIAVLVFTLLVRPQDLPEPEPVSPVKHLEERKATIYDNLRDLQFEYRVGKLSEADYQATKADLQKELAAVLAQIDAIQPAAAPRKAAAAAPASGRPVPAPGTECPHCGARFPKPMKFCGECGKAMLVEASK